jgi:hypothetical protein
MRHIPTTALHRWADRALLALAVIAAVVVSIT